MLIKMFAFVYLVTFLQLVQTADTISNRVHACTSNAPLQVPVFCHYTAIGIAGDAPEPAPSSHHPPHLTSSPFADKDSL